jgi:predicted DNA-binding transcriptional regulator AlpA
VGRLCRNPDTGGPVSSGPKVVGVRDATGLRLVDVARYLGISKQRVHQLAEEPGFPRPRHRPDGIRTWRREAIERWAARRWWGSKPWRTPR